MMSELAELMDIFRPETRMLFFHFFFVEFAYLFFAKGLSFVLDKPLPWEAVTMVNLRDETQAAYGGNFMAATLSSHMKSFRYQAKAISFFMLFCGLQALVIMNCFSDKCRWSQVAMALAEHYKTVDPDSRPNITTHADYFSYFGIIVYLIAINTVAVYVTNRMLIDHRQEMAEVGENVRRRRFTVIPFAIVWFGLTYKTMMYCKYAEAEFLKFFGGEDVAEPIGFMEFGHIYATLYFGRAMTCHPQWLLRNSLGVATEDGTS